MVMNRQVDPPSDDKRWRIVNATMRRHGYEPNALIETLHKVQESFAFIDDTALQYVSKSLRVPLSQAYGVATFYHFFSLKPKGKHSCVVCTGTACYIKGAQELLDGLGESFGIEAGETTTDNELSLMTARCIGSCGLAPAAVIDNETVPQLTSEKLVSEIRELIDNGS